jgi:hypothetical protein
VAAAGTQTARCCSVVSCNGLITKCACAPLEPGPRCVYTEGGRISGISEDARYHCHNDENSVILSVYVLHLSTVWWPAEVIHETTSSAKRSLCGFGAIMLPCSLQHLRSPTPPLPSSIVHTWELRIATHCTVPAKCIGKQPFTSCLPVRRYVVSLCAPGLSYDSSVRSHRLISTGCSKERGFQFHTILLQNFTLQQ